MLPEDRARHEAAESERSRVGKRRAKAIRPTELAITVIGAAGINSDGWLYADEIRGRLRWFGFEPSSQFVVSRLNAMCEEDVPRFERRERWGREKQYRVTRWGRNEIGNKLPGLERYR